MDESTAVPIEYYQYRVGQWEHVDAHVIREAPVSLSVNGEIWLNFMCTPSDLEALGVGFLFDEGLINSIDEVASVGVCGRGALVDVWLTHAQSKPPLWQRTTGCAGGLTAASHASTFQTINGNLKISPREILTLETELLRAQELYRLTGGVHTSILCDGETVLARSEDIGRHNTLDKIAGHFLLDRLNFQQGMLVTTGRISSEMLQKAARMRVPVLISRTSPNSMSVQMAQEIGITLVGYARRDQFLVYTHPERIEGVPKGNGKA